jgi:hypothetical protein
MRLQKAKCGAVCNISFPPENVCTFPPLGLHFERSLKQIFGYTALLYIILSRGYSNSDGPIHIEVTKVGIRICPDVIRQCIF